MANKVDRLETNNIQEFAKWLGNIDPTTLHKLYVSKNKSGYHCLVIHHEVSVEPVEKTPKLSKKGNTSNKTLGRIRNHERKNSKAS